jgi:hypothetical protein
MEKKHNQDDLVPEDVLERNQRYLKARRARKLYCSPQLQSLSVTLIIALMIRKNGTLEEKYVAQYAITEKKLNIPFILHKHINHPANMDVVDPLIQVLFYFPIFLFSYFPFNFLF